MTIGGSWVDGLLAQTTTKISSNLGLRYFGWTISNGKGNPFAFEVRPETIGQSLDVF